MIGISRRTEPAVVVLPFLDLLEEDCRTPVRLLGPRHFGHCPDSFSLAGGVSQPSGAYIVTEQNEITLIYGATIVAYRLAITTSCENEKEI